MIHCIVVAGVLYMGSTAGTQPSTMVKIDHFEFLTVVPGDFGELDGERSEVVLSLDFGGKAIHLGTEYQDKTAFDVLKECKAQVEGK